MFTIRVSAAFVLGAALAAMPLQASIAADTATTHHHSSAAHRTKSGVHRNSSHKASRKHARKVRGQQVIEPERVTEIQRALIREHYLKGEANGEWDAATITAMQKYQADQGWQTKLTPDSRALKKLGLGPDYSKAINAKGSSFAAPPPASTIPQGQTAGFAAAAGINR